MKARALEEDWTVPLYKEHWTVPLYKEGKKDDDAECLYSSNGLRDSKTEPLGLSRAPQKY